MISALLIGGQGKNLSQHYERGILSSHSFYRTVFLHKKKSLKGFLVSTRTTWSSRGANLQAITEHITMAGEVTIHLHNLACVTCDYWFKY